LTSKTDAFVKNIKETKNKVSIKLVFEIKKYLCGKNVIFKTLN